MQKDLSHFKKDIEEACKEILEFIEGYDFEKFSLDNKTYSAVLMKLAIIGEAASHFPEDIRLKNPHIDWRTIVAMRNFLVHEYFEVDPKIVWKTVNEDVPVLVESMDTLNLQ